MGAVMENRETQQSCSQSPAAQDSPGLQDEETGPSCEPLPKRKRQVLQEELCALCRQDVDSDIAGELCHQDGLYIHENCLYHAGRMIQRGADEEGFYGFLLPDIREELKRVAQKKCCICRLLGASVTCRGRRCRRIFHFPCGVERGCISQFFGEYKSYCWKHRPVQRVWVLQQQPRSCLICLEEVAERPCYDTLVCPVCTSAWFHRRCIQGHALFSALYHFRCPCCQDVDRFQEEMFRLGIKIPNRDAAWELDGYFEDLYEDHTSCDAEQCLCPMGQQEGEANGPWRLLRCSCCGSHRIHQRCAGLEADAESWQCRDCSDTSTTMPLAAAHHDSGPSDAGPSHTTAAQDTAAEQEETGTP